MSLLTITSRHRGHSETNSVIFHDSKIISRLVPAPTHQELRGHGTRVTVNNLFGNMPVRVKHRAISLRRSEDVDKEWEELTRMLVALALSNPGFQKLRVSDREKSRSFNLRIPHKAIESSTSGTQNSSLFRVHTILAQSGLTLGTSVDEWVKMSASTLDVSVKAYVALSPSPTKLNQFISLGINPVFTEHSSTNVLYDAINQVFVGSDFGSELSTSRSRESRHQGITRGPRRWPVFYVRLDVKSPLQNFTHSEATVELDRTLQHIIEVLQAMFYQFLQQHHYRPRKRKRAEREHPSTSDFRDSSTVSSANLAQQNRSRLSVSSKQAVSTKNTEAFDSEVNIPTVYKKESFPYFSNFTNWSRVKSGDTSGVNELLVCRPRDTSRPQTGTSLSYEAKSPDLVSVQAEVDHAPHTVQDEGDQVARWVDSSTNKVVLVNSRTGQCVSESQENARPNTSIGCIRTPLAASCLSHASASIKRPHTVPAQIHSPWFESLVHKCANTAFSCPEKPILSIENESVFGDSFRCHDAQMKSQQGWGVTELAVGDRRNGKLSREGLARATIIAQVDRKFILVRMTPANEDCTDDTSKQILVLVDQHAADERCRLECLLSEMFAIDELGVTSIHTHQFPQPVQCLVQGDEVPLLAAYSKYFESWGCIYKLHQELIDGRRHHSIMIEALPLAIAERCRLEPMIFIHLLRKEIWSRAGERIPESRKSTSTFDPTLNHEHPPFPWLHWIAGCPEGILDLINSRACRSSIMFNDPLPIDECQSLITRLSKCALPFQCAHGRPSMIPIVDESRHLLGSMASETVGYTEYNTTRRQTGFVEAFKKWERT